MIRNGGPGPLSFHYSGGSSTPQGLTLKNGTMGTDLWNDRDSPFRSTRKVVHWGQSETTEEVAPKAVPNAPFFVNYQLSSFQVPENPKMDEKTVKKIVFSFLSPFIFPDQVCYPLQIHRNCSEFCLKGHASQVPAYRSG